MQDYTFCVPCLFGLEGLVGDELKRLELKNVRVENGRVLFDGDFHAMATANVRMRMGERVLLRLGSFEARSFEALFQGVRQLPLENFIPKDGRFPVKGHCLNSQLQLHPQGRPLPGKGPLSELPAPLGARLPGHCEEGGGGPAGQPLPSELAAGDRGALPAPVLHYEGPGRDLFGYLRRGAAQAGLSGRGQRRAAARDSGCRHGTPSAAAAPL